jgi:RHS repeat-associated protein
MNMLWLLFLLMTSPLSSQTKYIDQEAGKQSLCVFIPRGPGLEVCFIEIGPLGSSITQADRDRLATAITDATNNTALPAFPKVQPSPRQYVYGSYVDEPLLLKAGANRYYYATNRLYSVAALTSQLGQVVERYLYDAYGRQTVLANNGVVAYKPSDYGQFVGFTGRYHDWETGLEYFRARYFDLTLGRFISRNNYGERDMGYSVLPTERSNVRLIYFHESSPSWRYIDGMGLYSGTFAAMQGLDPSGQPNDTVDIKGSRGDSAFIEVDKAGPGVGNEISVRSSSGTEIARFKYENGNWSKVETHAGSKIDYSAFDGDTKRGRALREFVDNAKLEMERHISGGSCDFGKLKKGLRIFGLLGMLTGMAQANEELNGAVATLQQAASAWKRDPSSYPDEMALKVAMKNFISTAAQYNPEAVVGAEVTVETIFSIPRDSK